MAYFTQGKKLEAEQGRSPKCWKQVASTLGAQGTLDTLYAMSLLGNFEALDGKVDKAEPLLVEALAGCRTALEPQS